MPYFGPLYNEAVVEKDILAVLIRATAINASRARRSSLQYFEHQYVVCTLSIVLQMNIKYRSHFMSYLINNDDALFYSFEERGKSLSTIIKNHKSKSTFESFTANVFSPVLPLPSFQTGHNNRASGNIVPDMPRTRYHKN